MAGLVAWSWMWLMGWATVGASLHWVRVMGAVVMVIGMVVGVLARVEMEMLMRI